MFMGILPRVCGNYYRYPNPAVGFRYRLPAVYQSPVKPNPLALPSGHTDLLRRASALLQLEQRHRARQSRAKEAIMPFGPVTCCQWQLPLSPQFPYATSLNQGPANWHALQMANAEARAMSSANRRHLSCARFPHSA